ncbi:cache domain-containing sensor histidine kinase [Paenibacillus monticola]|uniref:HAMP domain-containing protein n=1 Tax=Paenibacillus monticola TaxID=2666075 RepID=A0A7X2H318_9BACL|nr:sensor histidine kinase [Paenibacillus monticola]MRN52637.1 HAMP domain-containing protein [Paenibacillus monticola]
MRGFWERYKFHSLFIKIFIVMVFSIVAVAIAASWTTVRMSERLFMETFSITNSKVINQIKANFESFHYSIVTATNNTGLSGTIKSFLTEEDSNSLRVLRTYYNMTTQMKKIQSNVDAYQVGIKIMGKNGRSFSTNTNNLLMTDNELRNHKLTLNTLAEPKRLMYQFYQESSTVSSKQEAEIVASKALMERTTGDIYGTLYITIQEKNFHTFYASFVSTGNDVAILNKEGQIVSSNRAELLGQQADDLLGYAQKIESKGLDYVNVDFKGKDMIVLADYLSSYDFYIVNLIDKKTALGQMVDSKMVALICSAIVLVALVVVFLISRRLTRSLTLLTRQMSKITERNFHNYITVTGSFEFQELGHAYNYMLDELNDYVDKLVHTQKEQRNAELAALQHQINPHFLYNTLASVNFLVQQGSKEKAVQTIHALISMLQNALSNVSETITVMQELENLKSYVFINHVRYGERIRVNFFISPDCTEFYVPKLIIQPFIENAFFHAFNRKTEGYIHVLISQDAGSLICEVVDNGDGMDNGHTELPGAESKRQLFTGIGMKNVHDRIILLYGEEYGVTVVSNINEGTAIKIRLPLILVSSQN